MMPGDILLCDDECHILRAAEIKFRLAGYTVRCASDGEEGWQLINERRPDLLLTDCQMPRLDGLGLAARLRDDERFRTLPIIMLTAKGFELPLSEIQSQYGILAIVAKPFSPRELLRQVEAVLAERAATPAAV